MGAKKAVALRQAQDKLKSTSNKDFMAEVIKESPKFQGYVAAGTQGRFDKDSIEALSNNPEAMDEFYSTLMRVVFQKLNVARAENGFTRSGLVEQWAVPMGEYTQRMYVGAVAPISPQYRNLKQGDWINQYIINKPEVEQSFWKLNYDRQSLLTLKRVDQKRIFLEEGQMGALTAGLLEGINTGNTIQDSLVIKNAINTAINSKDHPLQAAQNIVISSWATGADLDSVTDEQLTDFLIAISNLFDSMFAVDNPATGLYNAAGFKTRVERNQYVMYARTGIKNRINKKLMVGAFNPSYLNLDLGEIYDINDFGGLIPYKEKEHTTQLYPIFTSLGSTTGYYISDADAQTAITEGKLKKSAVTTTEGESVTGYLISAPDTDAKSISGSVAESNVEWLDQNDDVIAVIAQRGVIGQNLQNAMEMSVVPNYLGMYQNYIANQPNNGIYYEHHYNFIVIRSKKQA